MKVGRIVSVHAFAARKGGPHNGSGGRAYGCDSMMDRVAVEKRILADDAALGEIIALLEKKVPLRLWPTELARALAGAVTVTGENPIEDAKARHLADHLTLGLGALPPAEEAVRTRLAERLRGHLAGCVPAGCLPDAPLRAAESSACPVPQRARPAIGIAQALDLVQDLIARHVAQLGEAPRTIVLAGDAALAAHGIRARIPELQLYLSVLDYDVVAASEDAARERLGWEIELAVTSVATLWGPLIVRDIDRSPVFAKLQLGGKRVPVRVLSPETLFILAAAAEPDGDPEDLDVIARHTTAGRILARGRKTAEWFGDLTRLPAHLGCLVRAVVRCHGWPIERVEAALCPWPSVRARLAARRAAESERYTPILEAAMRDMPDRLLKDATARGASTYCFPQPTPALATILKRRPDLVCRVAHKMLAERRKRG